MNTLEKILSHLGENTPMGDLAHDIKNDSKFPSDISSYDEIYNHILGKGYSTDAALNVLEENKSYLK